MIADSPVRLKRADLEGWALATYIPSRGRKARHYADTFSCALYLAKCGVRLPDGEPAGAVYGDQWAHSLAQLVPSDATIVACPPASRKRQAGARYLARDLADAVGEVLGLPVVALRWVDQGQEASKDIVHQAGKGRALGRLAVCEEDLTGEAVCIVDDMFTTGITAQLCAEALRRAGAERVTVATLGSTERTRDRPQHEREGIARRRELAALRRTAREWQCQRGER